MYLVEVASIPDVDDIEDVPLDDLMEVYKVCKQMEGVCTKEGGIGLSAVQVGIPWKLFLVRHGEKYGYYVNCEYSDLPESERVVSVEGCLSIRSDEGQLRHFRVGRWDKVQVTGLKIIDDIKLGYENIDILLGEEELSIVFQHEIDHHRGVLISDIGTEMIIWS